MAKYDGLIIPRSYNDYINKSDPLGVSQALQLTGVMDNAPTAQSTKPAKSGGIFDALAEKQPILTFDNAPTENSDNPVKSGGLFDAIDKKTLINVMLPVGKTLHIIGRSGFCGYYGTIQAQGSGAKFFQLRNTVNISVAQLFVQENVTISGTTIYAFVSKTLPYNFVSSTYPLTIRIENGHVYIENNTIENEAIAIICPYDSWEIINNVSNRNLTETETATSNVSETKNAKL